MRTTIGEHKSLFRQLDINEAFPELYDCVGRAHSNREPYGMGTQCFEQWRTQDVPVLGIYRRWNVDDLFNLPYAHSFYLAPLLLLYVYFINLHQPSLSSYMLAIWRCTARAPALNTPLAWCLAIEEVTADDVGTNPVQLYSENVNHNNSVYCWLCLYIAQAMMLDM